MKDTGWTKESGLAGAKFSWRPAAETSAGELQVWSRNLCRSRAGTSEGLQQEQLQLQWSLSLVKSHHFVGLDQAGVWYNLIEWLECLIESKLQKLQNSFWRTFGENSPSAAPLRDTQLISDCSAQLC